MATMAGPATVQMNAISIPPSLLSEVVFEFTEGTRERTTLGGTFTRASGTLETAMASFTLFLPSMDYLKNIFPGRFNAPTAPQTSGNVVWNANECAITYAGPVNIHFECETTDDNDAYMYNASAVLNMNQTLNSSDEVTIEVTLHANPDDDGNVARFGTGDLTAPSVYDPTTEETVPVAS